MNRLALTGSALAATAIGLAPIWRHVVLVGSGDAGITAVFHELGVYPSDVCLLLLAAVAIARPAPLDVASRCVALGMALLAAMALVSATAAPYPALAAGIAGHLVVLTLAWWSVRSLRLSRSVLATVLVATATVQSGLAIAQFLTQQLLVPPELGLPWLPSDAAQSGAPVILDAAGDRILRGFGTFPHPNVLGGFLAIAAACLPLVYAQLPRWRLYVWVASALLALGLLASFSRAAWLAAVAGVCVCWWTTHRQHAWLPAMAAGALLAGVAITPLAPLVLARVLPLSPAGNALERGSIEDRLALDGAAIFEITDHWQVGLGAGNDGPASVIDGYQEGWGEPIPNVPLLIAAELGLPGVVALALLLFGAARLVRGDARGPAVAVLVLAMFDHYLWTMPPGRVLAWIALAFSFGA